MDMVYPPLCLSCGGKKNMPYFLCPECLPFLEILNPALRCRHCFGFLGEEAYFCQKCLKCGRAQGHLASVFEMSASVASLLAEAERRPLFRLQKSLAAFMALQMINLKWTWPDFIAPLPGKKINARLAEGLSFFLKRGRINLLKYQPLDGKMVLKNSKKKIVDRTILIAADRLDVNLKKGVRMAYNAFPCRVYGLGLLKT